MATFHGFSQQGLTFLQQVRQENSKEWFDEHRQVYDEQLVAPFRALVEALSLTMLPIDDQFETRPAIGKTVSRIHRDTRFSHDKSRYRSQMWLTFKRHRKDWDRCAGVFLRDCAGFLAVWFGVLLRHQRHHGAVSPRAA